MYYQNVFIIFCASSLSLTVTRILLSSYMLFRMPRCSVCRPVFTQFCRDNSHILVMIFYLFLVDEISTSTRVSGCYNIFFFFGFPIEFLSDFSYFSSEDLHLGVFSQNSIQCSSSVANCSRTLISFNMLLIYLFSIHTYIIDHYNPSVSIIDLFYHATYVVCVNFIHKWLDLQLKVDSKRQIFRETFHGHFIYSQSF